MSETIAILGASGKLGREVVADALARGLAVRALFRRPPARPAIHETVVEGDACDLDAVRALVRGAGVVISLVGPTADSPHDLSTRFTHVLLDAMRAESVTRLVYVTGVMVGHPRAQRGLVYRILPRFFSAALRAGIEDRRRAETMVMTSGLEVTVVRPPRLAAGPPRGRVVCGETLRIGSFASIRRSDLAHFLVDTALDRATSGRALAVRG